MSFPKYPEYKESGVEWLGGVPKQWTCTSLKKGYVVTLGKMLQPERKTNSDVLKPYIRAANIQWAGIDVSDVKEMWFSPAEIESLSLEPGDLLVSEGGDVGRSALWRHDIVDCYFQNSVNRIRPFGGNSTEYLYYWMSALKDKGFIDVVCNKSTIAHFTAEKVQAVPVLFPPPEEQSAIAAFLDRETAKIDALVAEQEKLIELLKEKRQAVISHAVTKGLDPNVPMKDSGVEWMGDVPEHWEVAKLRRFVRTVQTGGTPSASPPSTDIEDGTDWFTPGDFSGPIRLGSASKKVPPEAIEQGEAKVFPAGAVLVVGIGATLGKIGYLLALASANQQINAILPNAELEGLFLAYSLSSKTAEMRNLSNASTIGIMNQEKTKEIWVAVPPLCEQEAIAKFLDQDGVTSDALITESQRAIDLLKERRSALISAAVTGKIDVRGLVDPISDNAMEKP